MVIMRDAYIDDEVVIPDGGRVRVPVMLMGANCR
jgi:hypothetical protein